jgi:hypothetical protein
MCDHGLIVDKFGTRDHNWDLLDGGENGID